MHRLSGQGPESDDFPCDQPGPVMGRSASPLANSEPARVDVTSALTSACKRVAGVEVLHSAGSIGQGVFNVRSSLQTLIFNLLQGGKVWQ
ncbi:hypothetical protein cypCar_00036217 [Cyprinus carpio]|nr:hypothetical protein cypCar_00036217 [Cyprinus carpio]